MYFDIYDFVTELNGRMEIYLKSLHQFLSEYGPVYMSIKNKQTHTILDGEEAIHIKHKGN